MAKLVGGEHARYQKADNAHRNNRESLGIGRGTVGPPGRDGLLVHHPFHAHSGHHRHQHGKCDCQCTDKHIGQILGRARTPEEQGREKQPDADKGRRPLPQPGGALRKRHRAENHQCDPAQHIAQSKSVGPPFDRRQTPLESDRYDRRTGSIGGYDVINTRTCSKPEAESDDSKLRPAGTALGSVHMLHIAVHIVHVAVHLVPIMRDIGVLRLRSRRFGLLCVRTLWMPGHAGRVQLVRFVPVLRVGFQRVDDDRKCVAERVLWLPPQQVPGT